MRIWKHFILAAAALAGLLPSLFAQETARRPLRILYWNIQNGMWSDQGNNYDNFVAFVRELDPDICIWAEAESRYRTDTDTKMAGCEEAYLPYNWDLLAQRYGHSYSVLAGKRDTFPQVITSKYPVRTLKRINGNGKDIIVVHGAGLAEVDVDGTPIRFVTLHTYPFKYAYLAEDRAKSEAEQGGDVFRAQEMEYICRQTLLAEDPAGEGLWMMVGDFNAISRVDNDHYKRPENDKAFLVHDYIRAFTPYVDLIKEWYPDSFEPTTLSGRRIDFMYLTRPLFEKVRSAKVLRDGFAKNWRDPRDLHGFCRPSDHYPILVEVEL
jgi:endonuclease/exonuclease/phosphatase family metal-dependent hydrolase